jgi:hypothetical protein
VFAGDEEVEVDFLKLLGAGSKAEYVVLGKVEGIEGEGMGKNDVSEEADEEDEEEILEEGRLRGQKSKEPGTIEKDKKNKKNKNKVQKKPQPQVRLIGGIDFRRITITVKGFQLDSRLSTYRFQSPNDPYAEKGYLDSAVELITLWSLARWDSLGGNSSANELFAEVLNRLESYRKEQKGKSKLRLPWEQELPKWCRIKLQKLSPSNTLKSLLRESLPEPPL